MKVKIFTHTDLDGIGCAILAYMAFGDRGFDSDKVDVEYCDYKNIDSKLRALGSDHDLYNSYDKIYITDISMSEELAADMDVCCNHDKIQLFDHHATALWLNKYDWCEVKVGDAVKTSGTELFYVHLLNNGYFDDCYPHYMENLDRFVEVVRDYDTWRWKEVLNEKEGLVCSR